MKTALLFPGQGSQYVGMGRSLWDRFACVKELFDEASEELDFDVRRLCFDGPEELLQATRYTQPCVFLVSVAAYLALREAWQEKAFRVAGHSLGEYAALVAAGSLTFVEGLRAVRERARLMDEASRAAEGAMSALLGLDRAQVEEICAQVADGDVLVPANYNGPGQIVVSGGVGAIERAERAARARGAKAVRLPVSAAFHTELMSSAAQAFSGVLEAISFRDPDPVWVSNVTASEVRSGERCRSLLAVQITSPVLWEDSVRFMVESGVDRFVEVGPGRVLKGLCKRICRTIPCDTIDSAEDVEALRKAVPLAAL
jgi:[acyl-carrier-protein] S-malonyltransferase